MIDSEGVTLPFLRGKLTGALFMRKLTLRGFEGEDGGLLSINGGQLFMQNVKLESMWAVR